MIHLVLVNRWGVISAHHPRKIFCVQSGTDFVRLMRKFGLCVAEKFQSTFALSSTRKPQSRMLIGVNALAIVCWYWFSMLLIFLSIPCELWKRCSQWIFIPSFYLDFCCLLLLRFAAAAMMLQMPSQARLQTLQVLLHTLSQAHHQMLRAPQERCNFWWSIPV